MEQNDRPWVQHIQLSQYSSVGLTLASFAIIETHSVLSRQKVILVHKYLGLHGCQRAKSASDLGFSRLRGHTIFHCPQWTYPCPSTPLPLDWLCWFHVGPPNSPCFKIKSEHCHLSPNPGQGDSLLNEKCWQGDACLVTLCAVQNVMSLSGE